GDITNTTGMGAFIGPDLVVTAAHLVVPHDDTDSSGVVVTGVRRDGTVFAERVKAIHYAADFPVPYHAGYPVGSDVAVLQLHSPIFGLDILHLPEDLGVNVGQQESIIGTVYGQMIPSREFIESAYDRLITAEGQLTDEGRREFEERSDGPERRLWMPGEIAINGAVRVKHPWKDGAPFVRIQVPRSGDNVFSGETDIAVGLTMDMEREKFIDGAYFVAENLPFHQGDSGAPFVSITENGEAYLAGVVSDERSRRDATESTLFRPRVSGVATGSVFNILQRIGPDRPRTVTDDWGFWANPNNSVAHESNWNVRNGDIRLLNMPEPPEESYQKTCESSDSAFCRYLRSEPTREYKVTPLAIQVNRDMGTLNPYGGIYIINGILRYFSPQSDFDHATQKSQSVFDAPNPHVMRLPVYDPKAPYRKVIARKAGPSGLMPYTDFSPFLPHEGAAEATIRANVDAPMICLITPSDHGVGNGPYPTGGEILIDPQGLQCTVLDERTGGANGTYLVPITPREGFGGATVTIQFRVEPK
ncbi:hypothetical protein ACEK07_15470, partial [Alcanivoracaceae bacterium MT1]